MEITDISHQWQWCENLSHVWSSHELYRTIVNRRIRNWIFIWKTWWYPLCKVRSQIMQINVKSKEVCIHNTLVSILAQSCTYAYYDFFMNSLSAICQKVYRLNSLDHLTKRNSMTRHIGEGGTKRLPIMISLWNRIVRIVEVLHRRNCYRTWRRGDR